MSVVAPGTCRHCGCTDEQRCRLHRHAADDFAWTTAQRLVCNGRECQMAEVDRKAAAKRSAKEAQPMSLFARVAAQHPKWERGAILAEVRRIERRRGKGRAA